MELLDEKVTRGYIVFLYNPSVDRYRSQLCLFNNYAAGFIKYGYFPIFFNLTADKAQERIIEHLKNGYVKAFYAPGGWGSDLQITKESSKRSIFEYCNKPVICTFGDYPFAPWVYDKLTCEFKNKFVFHTDKTTKELVSQFVSAPAYHDYVPTLCQDFRYDRKRAAKPYKDRKYSFLYVGSYEDPEENRKLLIHYCSEMLPVFEALIDEALFNYHEPVWKIGMRIFEKMNQHFDMRTEATRLTLHLANQYIRFRRRQLILEKLARYPGYFVLARGKPPLDFHPDAIISAEVPVYDALEIFYDSKASVMSLPNFAYGHSERMLNSMHRGCVTISTSNSIINNEFQDGRDFLALSPRFENLDEQMAKLEDVNFCQEVADNGRFSVEKHHLPDDIVGGIISKMNSLGIEL